MVTQILKAPDIWKIQVPLPDNPLKELNCYIVQTQRENLVIDTGFRHPESRRVLLEGMAEIGLSWERTSLFLTHLHSDHTGLAPLFAERGCTIYMNGIDYDILRDAKAKGSWSSMERRFAQEGFPSEELAAQATHNHGRIYEPEQLFPVCRVKDGSRVKTGQLEFHCIHVPGHTPGQTLLYLPGAQILFTADHILFDITPNIGVWEDVSNPLKDYLQSLDKVMDLPVQIALPAHRSCNNQIAQRIQALKEHHAARPGEILRIVRDHPGITGYTVASMTKWSARGHTWQEFSLNQKWFAVSETLVHLQYLCNSGLIKRIKEDKYIYYPVLKYSYRII